ncbi:MAG: adaptor protein MecA [Clostridia bacterium]|nr:adaptor protein MecA [Clostridia bacterium]
MEIIKIGSDSLKISLCTKEANEYKLDKIDNELMKNSFLKLLLKVKESISYKAIGEKIVAEIFSGKDGGCEIFVSRVEVTESMYKEKTTEEAVKKPKQLSTIYSFDNVDKLLMAINRLHNIRYSGTSSAYYDEEKDKYYILLEDVSSKDIRYAFMNEYARYIRGSLSSLIKEHCKCICKRDAVKKLSNLL